MKNSCMILQSQSFSSPALRKMPDLGAVHTRTVSYDSGQGIEQLDSSGMFHWCQATSLDKVILKRSEKRKHEFRNHVVACVFGDAKSTLMGLRNFVMPLRASNYTLKELKDIVFIGSLDYLQREWRFLWNFPQIYILPGSALFSGDLHAANIEECSMCAVLSPPYKPSSNQTPVDTETIMATLNIGSLRISCCAQTPSVAPGFSQNIPGVHKTSKHRRIPILTELRNPSNISFIEQLGGMKEGLPGTNLHLSTCFSTGAVFSGSFLDSLLATAYNNYRVLELLQMLVTGGISGQLEQHLDKDKHYGPAESSTTFYSARARCKIGLLSLNKTILSDIQPKDYFGEVFCGSLDNFGILCLGLYRMIDEEEHNPEHKRCFTAFAENSKLFDFLTAALMGIDYGHKQTEILDNFKHFFSSHDIAYGSNCREACFLYVEGFVITRPATDFKLLPTDLVFCAIPFSTYYHKNYDEQVYETVNSIQGNVPDSMNPPTIKVSHHDEQHSTALSMDEESTKLFVCRQPKLSQRDKLSFQIHPAENGKDSANTYIQEIDEDTS